MSWDILEKNRKARQNTALVAKWRSWDHEHFERYKLPYDDPERKTPEDLQIFAEDNWLGLIDDFDVLIKVFGWQPKRNRFGRPFFSKKEIGLKPYMSAYMAVRKSLARLVDRGLLHHAIGGKYSGYYLTEEGQALMAKLGK